MNGRAPVHPRRVAWASASLAALLALAPAQARGGDDLQWYGLAWSARAGWNGRRLSFQATHVDNRADGLAYGTQRNWTTRFEIVGAELALGSWTIAAENGWGPSSIDVRGRIVTADIQAGSILVSRRFSRARATVRFDSYAVRGERESALALAGLVFPRDRPGVVPLGCNIHDRMSAFVVVADTPYFGVARDGRVELAEVPEGAYLVHVWHEGGRDAPPPRPVTLAAGESARLVLSLAR